MQKTRWKNLHWGTFFLHVFSDYEPSSVECLPSIASATCDRTLYQRVLFLISVLRATNIVLTVFNDYIQLHGSYRSLNATVPWIKNMYVWEKSKRNCIHNSVSILIFLNGFVSTDFNCVLLLVVCGCSFELNRIIKSE